MEVEILSPIFYYSLGFQLLTYQSPPLAARTLGYYHPL